MEKGIPFWSPAGSVQQWVFFINVIECNQDITVTMASSLSQNSLQAAMLSLVPVPKVRYVR